jgi:mono/diheme cytochrome c family protein
MLLGVAMSLSVALAIAQTPPKATESPGALLYSTYCVACHTTQVHWRDMRLATDWASLTNQVRRWQANAKLTWSDEEIAAVARYLNTLYYHFPETGNRVSRASDSGAHHIASPSERWPNARSDRAQWQ